jgi:hypothetical protein
VTTRMTVQRLERLIAAGDVDAVRTAVQSSPGLLTRTVERDGQGGWTSPSPTRSRTSSARSSRPGPT